MSIHTYVYTYIPCRTCPAGLGFRYVYVAPAPLEALFFSGEEKKKGCCMHTPHSLEFARRAPNTLESTFVLVKQVICTHFRPLLYLEFARRASNTFVQEKKKGGGAVAYTHLTRCSSRLQFARRASSTFVQENPVLLY